jgi:type IV secretion system protein VirD4
VWIVVVILGLWLAAATYAYVVPGQVITNQRERAIRALAFGPTFGPLNVARVAPTGRVEISTSLTVPLRTAMLIGLLPLGLCALILFGDQGTRDRKGRYVREAARYASGQGRPGLEEVARKLRLKGGGVPLGQVNGVQIGAPYGNDRGQAAVIGPNRSGKGLHLTEALLSWPGAAVVVDPRGEQYERTAGHRQQFGPIYRLPTHGLDLADYFNLSDSFDLQELHKQLLRTWQDREPIFGEKSLSLFRAAVKTGKAVGAHPLALLGEWAGQPPVKALELAWEHAQAEVEQFTDGVALAELDRNRFALSAWGTFTARFGPFVPHLRTVTDGAIGPNWIEQHATIYITYPLDQLRAAGGIVSAVVAGLFKSQMRHGKRDFTLFAIDELPVTALYNLDVYLSTGGGSGAMFLLYAQTLSQLREVYGQDGAETVLGNCHHQIYYPPRDPETARYISEMFGTELDISETPSYSSSSGSGGQTRKSYTERRDTRPALDVAQVLALPEAATIVFSTLAGPQYRILTERMNPIWKLGELRPPPALVVTRQRAVPITIRPIERVGGAALPEASPSSAHGDGEMGDISMVSETGPEGAQAPKKRERLF